MNILLLFLCAFSAFAKPSWRFGAGISPYHFEYHQRGDLKKDAYASNVLSSIRVIGQKQNSGWIWNNEFMLSMLNFSNGDNESIPLYDFHTGILKNGVVAGVESSKNLLIDNTEDRAKPVDLRTHWLALGYRFTPKDANWRLLSKFSLPVAGNVSGDKISTISGYRLGFGYERLGAFKSSSFMKDYSWTINPYLDLKYWHLKLDEGGINDLKFHEYGLTVGVNRLF